MPYKSLLLCLGLAAVIPASGALAQVAGGLSSSSSSSIGGSRTGLSLGRTIGTGLTAPASRAASGALSRVSRTLPAISNSSAATARSATRTGAEMTAASAVPGPADMSIAAPIASATAPAFAGSGRAAAGVNGAAAETLRPVAGRAANATKTIVIQTGNTDPVDPAGIPGAADAAWNKSLGVSDLDGTVNERRATNGSAALTTTNAGAAARTGRMGRGNFAPSGISGGSGIPANANGRTRQSSGLFPTRIISITDVRSAMAQSQAAFAIPVAEIEAK